MKNKIPLIVIGVILLFSGLAVGRFAIAPIVQNYLNTPTPEVQNFTPTAISTNLQQNSGPIMLATPDGDEATDQVSSNDGIGTANGSLGDATLQTGVWNLILKAESGQGCSDVTSTDIDVSKQPDPKGAWTEEWTVKACGGVRVFKVLFTANPNGGTSIEITG